MKIAAILHCVCVYTTQVGITALHELAARDKSDLVLYLMENFNTNLDAGDCVSCPAACCSLSIPLCYHMSMPLDAHTELVMQLLLHAFAVARLILVSALM